MVLTEAEYCHVDADDYALSVFCSIPGQLVALGALGMGLVGVGRAHCDGWEELPDSS